MLPWSGLRTCSSYCIRKSRLPSISSQPPRLHHFHGQHTQASATPVFSFSEAILNPNWISYLYVSGYLRTLVLTLFFADIVSLESADVVTNTYLKSRTEIRIRIFFVTAFGVSYFDLSSAKGEDYIVMSTLLCQVLFLLRSAK